MHDVHLLDQDTLNKWLAMLEMRPSPDVNLHDSLPDKDACADSPEVELARSVETAGTLMRRYGSVDSPMHKPLHFPQSLAFVAKLFAGMTDYPTRFGLVRTRISPSTLGTKRPLPRPEQEIKGILAGFLVWNDRLFLPAGDFLGEAEQVVHVWRAARAAWCSLLSSSLIRRLLMIESAITSLVTLDASYKFRAKCPELLELGRVYDFFTLQPVPTPRVFLLRVVLHDWPDAFDPPPPARSHRTAPEACARGLCAPACVRSREPRPAQNSRRSANPSSFHDRKILLQMDPSAGFEERAEDSYTPGHSDEVSVPARMDSTRRTTAGLSRTYGTT
ncbi:hypothetical protein B0H14DRAFT_2644886 [Mycena olivaceomarginata]|nr:hypothetical protein B0H14DRAFT_2644886 [Mycena olivaceomarginata]